MVDLLTMRPQEQCTFHKLCTWKLTDKQGANSDEDKAPSHQGNGRPAPAGGVELRQRAEQHDCNRVIEDRLPKNEVVQQGWHVELAEDSQGCHRICGRYERPYMPDSFTS